MRLVKSAQIVLVANNLYNVLRCQVGRCLLLLWCAIFAAPVNAADDILSFIDVSLQSTPNSIAVSADGANVYATSLLGGLTSYARDSASGVLTIKAVYSNDISAGVVGLTEPWRVMVSPDDLYVYVLSRGEDALTLFQRNIGNGSLEFIASYQNGSDNISSMVKPGGLVISPDGKHLYVVNSGRAAEPGSVVSFSRNTNGRLTFLDAFKDGVNDIEGLSTAQDIAITPDGKNLYVVSNNVVGSNNKGLVQFSRDAESGQLYFLPSNLSITGVVGGQAIAVSPDGQQVYVTRDAASTLAMFNRDAVSGQLTQAEEYTDIAEARSDDLLGVAITPDGGQVMVSSYDIPLGDSSSAVHVYRRNPLDGTLSLAGSRLHQSGVLDGLKSVSALAFTPNGDQMFTASTDVSLGPNANDVLGNYGIASVDLSVVSIPDAASVIVGDSFHLTFMVSNDGDDNASGVAAISRIPVGVGVVDVTPDTGDCSYTTGIVQCELGNISAGVTTSVDVVLTATKSGRVDGEVMIFSNQRDIDITDNSDIGSVIVEVSGALGSAPSDGGGGAFGWIVCLLLGVALMRREQLHTA